jgi:hypothetical protein
MQTFQAYRFALDPSPRTARALASHVGARRFAFNWGLALVKERPVDYPSSKRCFACGSVKDKLALWERTYRCEVCGTELDRDLNAAYNLAALVAAVAGSGPGRTKARGEAVRPGLAGRTSMKREAGTGETGPGSDRRLRPATGGCKI